MSRSRMPALVAGTALLLAVALALPASAQAPQPPTTTPNPVPLDTPTGDGTAVRLTTDLGDILIGLFTESAPVASENFLDLSASGYYDGTGFHRVVPGFVIQGGDPEGTGQGGPGYTIPDEQVVGIYGRGIVAMARTRAPDSARSQFFIVLDDSARASLESANTYVIFGRVIEGMDVVDAIADRGPASNHIEDPVRIISASVEQAELPPESTPEPPTAAELDAIELATHIPRAIGDLELQTDTIPTDQVLSGTSDALTQLAEIAVANGADVNDLALAVGGADSGDAYVSVVGASIAGVAGALIEEPMARILIRDYDSSQVSHDTIAGRDVTLIKATSDATAQDTIYVLSSDAAVWFVLGDRSSVEAVIGALE